MMKRILWLPALLLGFTALGQNEPKVPVIGIAPGLYLMHQVQPGETLSAIAKTYNESVGNIMRLNGMNAKSQLSPSTVINIPVPVANVKQTPGGLALTHVAAPGESLYRISVNHGKVPVAALQQWNKLEGNAISLGQELIVGYLPIQGSNAGAIAAIPQAQSVAGTATTTAPATPTAAPVKPAPAPAPVATNTPAAPAATQPPPASAPAPSTAPVPAAPAPVATTSTPAPTATASPAPAPTTAQSTTSNSTAPAPKLAPGESFFAPLFGKNVEGRDKTSKQGNAAIFKTAAGWADRKYYIMMDAVPPGQIVEVSNAAGKKIYAKVLWHMRDMKENEGYTYRLSNAAAAALGFSELKFDINVTYFE